MFGEEINRRLRQSVVSRPSPLKSRLVSHGWYSDWSQYLNRIVENAQKSEYIILADFSNYFDAIDLNRLRLQLEQIGISPRHARLVWELLERCSLPDSELGMYRIGMPQLYDDTPALLANFYLRRFDDDVCQSWPPELYARWMDEFALGERTERLASRAVAQLSEQARRLGLNLNPYKTKVVKAKDIFRDHLYIDSHRRIDEFELRFVLEHSARDSGRAVELFARLERSVRSRTVPAYSELLLRRLYRLGAEVGSTHLIQYFSSDLVQYPGSASAIAQYLSSISWQPKITDGIVSYLRHPSSLYETVEASLLLSLLRRDLSADARRMLRLTASNILAGKIPILSKASIGIAALLLLRCSGFKAASEIASPMRSQLRSVVDPHTQRYMFAALSCAERRKPSQRIMAHARRRRDANLGLLWEYLRRLDFSYEDIAASIPAMWGESAESSTGESTLSAKTRAGLANSGDRKP